MQVERETLASTKKARERFFNDPIYRHGWLIITGGTKSKAVKRFAKIIGVDPWGVSEGAMYQGHFSAVEGHKSALIWFSCRHPEPQIVAHECFHAAMWVMEGLGLLPLQTEQDEAVAYYLEWLVKSVNEALK